MGEVYRATDTKLDRDVAIKVLPAEVVQDAERLGRFRREAKVLASLNHPNIASIYGLEDSDGTPFLVLELVDGEDLAERLKRGAIPVGEALEIAQQIAEALEEAHEKGIVHRDLKPANVKLTPDGKVKVLDFGLAKAYAADTGPVGSASDLSQSPTVAQSGTAAGVILGTASYMSPEQASGKPVDKRADIWAFGVVLFEMLTGRRLFGGETVSEVLASVIKDEPDWDRLPGESPPALRKLLLRCLEKNPRRRLHDIADAQLEIDEALNEPSGPYPAAGSRGSRSRERRAWVVAMLVAMAAGVAIGGSWRGRPPQGATHLAVNLPADHRLARVGGASVELALSPDGNLLAFTAERAGESRLFLRALDQPEATPLPGTEGGHAPFFSPDGEWVGFFAKDGRLEKVSVAGGTPVAICDPKAGTNPGASWGSDDTIVLYPGGATGGLWRVSAAGGPATELPDRVRWPQILPGGRHVLGGRVESSVVMSLETGELRPLKWGLAGARYAPSGHLVYGEAGSLMAVGFDPDRLEPRGSPRPVLEDIYMHPYDLAYFTLSETGTMAYVPGRDETTLEWVDRDGRETPLSTEPGEMVGPRVAPDGRRIAVPRLTGRARLAGPRAFEVWVYDAERGTGSRLGPGYAIDAWTSDSERVVFTGRRDDQRGIFWQPADGSRPGDALWVPTGDPSEGPFRRPSDLPGDPSLRPAILRSRGQDIWVLPSEGDPRTLVGTPFADRHPALSPDGNWLAYASNETGRFEIYVQQYPGGGEKQRISTDGGVAPVWSPDGGALFYRVASGDKVMSVLFAPPDEAGQPQLLFEGDYVADSIFRNYDIAPDGERFLMMKKPVVRTINVVLNWFDELKAKMGEAEK